MKLKEKLADEFVRYYTPILPDLERKEMVKVYIAGFEKARELIVEHFRNGKEYDVGFRYPLIEDIQIIGEEEI